VEKLAAKRRQAAAALWPRPATEQGLQRSALCRGGSAPTPSKTVPRRTLEAFADHGTPAGADQPQENIEDAKHISGGATTFR